MGWLPASAKVMRTQKLCLPSHFCQSSNVPCIFFYNL